MLVKDKKEYIDWTRKGAKDGYNDNNNTTQTALVSY
jgi:hypothetical protein